MQIVGRECAACGSELRKLGEGDGCGACDVVLCKKCLQGTARCPSCQREIGLTRDHSPRAGASVEPMVARGRSLVLAVVLGLAAAWVIVPAFSPITSVPRLLVQAFVLLALVYQLLRGRALARWVLALLGALGAATNLYVGMHMP
ncbi:MAG: hypothetical protein K8H88_32790, partial [Sandaracinaceae bacterium]|nr:hypothetical protein [Sandaracinaceae bacterium]